MKLFPIAFHKINTPPENLPDAVGRTREQFEQEAKWAMAIKLFEMKRLSSGQAAALVGTDRVSFLLNLERYGVAMIEESEEELLSDERKCLDQKELLSILHHLLL